MKKQTESTAPEAPQELGGSARAALLACPFCGGEAATGSSGLTIGAGSTNEKYETLTMGICKECGTNGPVISRPHEKEDGARTLEEFMEDDEAAAGLWNKRSS